MKTKLVELNNVLGSHKRLKCEIFNESILTWDDFSASDLIAVIDYRNERAS